MAITDSVLFAHLMRSAISPHPLHISQQLPKKRMPAQRGRIAHQQQLAPCAGHAHVHAADVRQEADLALGVAARQGDGDDVALLALKRIDGAYWRKLKQRLNAEGGQPVTFCHGLKLATPDIRARATRKHGLKNGYCRLNRSSSASR